MPILWNWLGLHLGRVFTMVVGSDVLYILTRPLYNHADFSLCSVGDWESNVKIPSHAYGFVCSIKFCRYLLHLRCLWTTHTNLHIYNLLWIDLLSLSTKGKVLPFLASFAVCMHVHVHVCVCVFDMCVSLCVHVPVKAREQGWVSSSTNFYFIWGTRSLIELGAPQLIWSMSSGYLKA